MGLTSVVAFLGANAVLAVVTLHADAEAFRTHREADARNGLEPSVMVIPVVAHREGYTSTYPYALSRYLTRKGKAKHC